MRRIPRQGNDLSEVVHSLNIQELPLDVVKSHFHTHNQQVLDLATLLLDGRFQDEPRVYDMYYTHMLMIADAIYMAVR